MPTFTVETEGDAGIAAGRLALAGVQSLSDFREGGRTSARLRAESSDEARERVTAALGDGFEIGEPAEE